MNGRWWYLYRAIDRFGSLVDVRLSEKRDMTAAKAFFRSAKAVNGVTPARVTTDGHDSYPRAIRTELGEGVKHRTNQYLNNRIEQEHRGIKGRVRTDEGLQKLSIRVALLSMFRRTPEPPASPFTPWPKSYHQRPPPSFSDPWDHRAPDPGSGLIVGRAASLNPTQWRDH